MTSPQSESESQKADTTEQQTSSESLATRTAYEPNMSLREILELPLRSPKPTPEGSPGLTCPDCRRSYVREGWLKRHLKNAHGKTDEETGLSARQS